jgi:hypothetical protein
MVNITSKGLLYFLPITFILFTLFWPQCGAATEENVAPLKGYWQCQEEGERFSLEFQSQTKLIYNGQATTYQILPNVLRVQEDYGVTDYYFEIQDATLIIFSPDGSVSYCQQIQKPNQQEQKTRQSQQDYPQETGGMGKWPPVYARPAEANIDAPSLQALLYKFAGRWDHITSNTLTNLFLKPDGTYAEAYESSYGGTFTDQGGYQTGNWGATGSENAQGTWRIEGSLRQGRIFLTSQNGNQTIINYQVHVKGGETFWGEYFFNNKIYFARYIYR